MKKLITVVIPAYNHDKFISATVESVLQQSWQELELLIIDDGSTDRTAEIIQSYADPRLSYFYQKNQDAYNTINRGIRMAKGDYVAILNSDDVYTTDRLERMVEAQQKSGAVCLFSDVIPIDAQGQQLTDPQFGWNRWHQKNRNFYQNCGDLYMAFLKGNFMVTTSNLFMTREAVAVVGKFCSLRYLHDYDFIFRMMLAFPKQVHCMFDEKLLYYRIHDGNTLGEAAITGREQDRDIIRKYMLARISDEYKSYAGAGSDRLVDLQQELNDVRQTLADDAEPSVSECGARLVTALKYKIRKKLRL